MIVFELPLRFGHLSRIVEIWLRYLAWKLDTLSSAHHFVTGLEAIV